jgi:hypothetical protein
MLLPQVSAQRDNVVGRFMAARGLRQPNFAIVVGLALLVIAVDLIVRCWAGTAETLGETDDAMRLLQVREFLGGQGWFDLHEPRLGPPLGYDSHWSRLIDAGLAGLFLVFHAFADAASAERLMRVVWPMLWLVPTILAMLATAWRLADRAGALVALLLAVVGLPAFQQFLPGRIDHHNVQIALAMLVLAATVWSDRLRWTASAAGALSGLALAVGLENLVFVALCGAAIALRYIADCAAGGALMRYGVTLAVGAAAAFFVSVPPDHWGHSVCDTIAINWAAPAVAAGALLALAAWRLPDARPWVRCAGVAGAAAVAAAIFVILEPRCLGGPYATMDPQLRAIWFEHVSEMQSIWRIARNSPAMAAAVVAFPLASLVATLLLARERDLRRDPAFLVAAAMLVAACALTAGVAKMCMYAMWFGMPLAAAACLRLFAWLGFVRLLPRALVALLLTPTLLSAGALAIAEAAGSPAVEQDDVRVLGGCFKIANFAQLARLAPGVMATEIDLGAYVLASTPHSVVGAPYHRLEAGIVAAHQAFALPPPEARKLFARLHVDYLVTCGDRAPPGLVAAERRDGLWGRLHAGAPPDWLAPLPSAPGDVFKVYRIAGSATGR